MGAFESAENIQAWWNSDDTFSALKGRRDIVPKLGFYVVEGLLPAFDILDQERYQFGEKFILIELVSMLSFRPVQKFVDNYKECSRHAMSEADVDVNPLFSEGI